MGTLAMWDQRAQRLKLKQLKHFEGEVPIAVVFSCLPFHSLVVVVVKWARTDFLLVERFKIPFLANLLPFRHGII